MNVTQRNAVLARENLAAVQARTYAALDALPFPDDYVTNDTAAMAYEIATEAIRAEHGLPEAESLTREAEDAMIAWAIGIVRSRHPREYAPIASLIERAKAMHTYRDRLVDLCLRLRA